MSLKVYSQNVDYSTWLIESLIKEPNYLNLSSALDRIRKSINSNRELLNCTDETFFADKNEYKEIQRIFESSLPEFERSRSLPAPSPLSIPKRPIRIIDRLKTLQDQKFLSFIKTKKTDYPLLNKHLIFFVNMPLQIETQVLSDCQLLAEDFSKILTELNNAWTEHYEKPFQTLQLTQKMTAQQSGEAFAQSQYAQQVPPPQVPHPNLAQSAYVPPSQPPISDPRQQPVASFTQSYYAQPVPPPQVPHPNLAQSAYVPPSQPPISDPRQQPVASFTQSYYAQPVPPPQVPHPNLAQSAYVPPSQPPAFNPNLLTPLRVESQKRIPFSMQNLEGLKKEELLALLKDFDAFYALYKQSNRLTSFEQGIVQLWESVQEKFYGGKPIENPDRFFFSQYIHERLKNTNFFEAVSVDEIRCAFEALQRQQRPNLSTFNQAVPTIPVFQPFAAIPQSTVQPVVQAPEPMNGPEFSLDDIKNYFKDPISFETFFERLSEKYSFGIYLTGNRAEKALNDFYNTVKRAYENRTQEPFKLDGSLRKDVFIAIIDLWFFTSLKSFNLSYVFNELNIDPTDLPNHAVLSDSNLQLISHENFVNFLKNPESFDMFYSRLKMPTQKSVAKDYDLCVSFYASVQRAYRERTLKDFNAHTCDRSIWKEIIEQCWNTSNLKKPSPENLTFFFNEMKLSMSQPQELPSTSIYINKSKDELIALLKDSSFFNKIFDFLVKKQTKTAIEDRLLEFCWHIRNSVYRRRGNEALEISSSAEKEFFTHSIQQNIDGWFQGFTASQLRTVFEQLP